MDPNANRNTVRDVQNELRSEVIPGDRTMYEIIWDTEEDKEDKEATKSKILEIYRKLVNAAIASEIWTLEMIRRRQYADSGEREAARTEIRVADQEKRWDEIFSEEGIDESVFESELDKYMSADAGFNAAIGDIYTGFKARIENVRDAFRIL
jgi:hypothetical protein